MSLHKIFCRLLAVATPLIMIVAAKPLQAAMIISPHAADLQNSSYSASSTFANQSAQQGFNGGNWNAGAFGTQWIQADMLSSKTLSEVRLTVGQQPNGVTWHNVYISATPIGDNWTQLTPIATQFGFTTNHQLLDLIFTPTTGRYLEIVSNGGPSWTSLGNSGARVNWVDPYIATPVSEPETYAMLLTGIGLMGTIARRKKPQQVT